MVKILVGLFLLGFSFGSGPCLAGCGPLVISYIVGTHKTGLKGFTTYILFSLGRISVYIILSILIFLLGRLIIETWLADFSKYVFMLSGAFIVFIGLLILLGNRLEFGVCRKSILGLGLVIGLLPCGPLLVMFSYIGLVSKTWLESLLYSLSFGIGTIISPLLVLAILAGFIPQFFSKRSAFYSRIFNLISGAIIIFLGANLISRAI